MEALSLSLSALLSLPHSLSLLSLLYALRKKKKRAKTKQSKTKMSCLSLPHTTQAAPNRPPVTLSMRTPRLANYS